MLLHDTLDKNSDHAGIESRFESGQCCKIVFMNLTLQIECFTDTKVVNYWLLGSIGWECVLAKKLEKKIFMSWIKQARKIKSFPKPVKLIDRAYAYRVFIEYK